MFEKLYVYIDLFFKFTFKKKFIFLFIVVYFFSYVLNILFFVNWKNVIAEKTLIDTSLVAIFVEEWLYDDIKDDIDWYATKYVQSQLSNSKALVFPINVSHDDGFDATNIVHILENIYFDWLDWDTSSLKWVVLVWDIPFPVVNFNSFVYPSIYPYTDLEDQQFIFDDNKWYFVFNWNKNWQAEIWHGVINFDKVSDYSGFFEKLKTYISNPVDFVAKKIWYDDFVANKKYYSKQTVNTYINNFLFAEDIAYNRFTNLMLDLLKWNYTSASADALAWLTEIEAIDEDLDGWAALFNESVASYWVELWGLDSTSMTEVEANTVPTLLLKSSISQFLKQYSDLFSTKYLAKMRDNVDAAGRWPSFDSHYKKVVHKDARVISDPDTSLPPAIVGFNDLLEKWIDDKIEAEKYYMKIPVIDWYETYKNKEKKLALYKRCKKEKYSVYQNYYFWSKVNDINSSEDFSIYRWTYRNLNLNTFDDLTLEDVQSSNNNLVDVDIDLHNVSVWWTYGIFSTQIEANRWYNTDTMSAEADLFEKKKVRTHVNADCMPFPKWKWLCIWKKYSDDEDYNGEDDDGLGVYDTTEEFALRSWWGASSINLDKDLLKQNVYKLLSYDYKQAWLPIYDIWGSQAILAEKSGANSYLWYRKYASLIRIVDEYWNKTYPKYLNGNLQPLTKESYDFNKLDFWDVYNNTGNRGVFGNIKIDGTKNIYIWTGRWISYSPMENFMLKMMWLVSLDKTKSWFWSDMPWKKCDGQYKVGNNYRYKIFDTRIKNISMTNDQLAWEWFGSYETWWFMHNNYLALLMNIDSLFWQLDAIETTIKDDILSPMASIRSYSKSTIDNIDKFLNYDFKSSTSSSDIRSWRNSLRTMLSSSELTAIKKSATNINVALNDSVASFEYLSLDWINFNFNEPIFMWWEETINDKLLSLKSKFNTIKYLYSHASSVSKINNVPDNYNGIIGVDEINISKLKSKRKSLDRLIKNGSWNRIGCDHWEKYYRLCKEISSLISSINDYNVFLDDGSVSTTGDIKSLITESYFDENWSMTNNINLIVNKLNTSNFLVELSSKIDEVKNIKIVDPDLVKTTPAMTYTTKDRPIDSPKYITFQWVWGGLVKFIYPNFYHVEVFEKNSDWLLVLKSVDDIKRSINKYLIDIVNDYNKKLSNEMSNRDKYYNDNILVSDWTNNAFRVLAEVDKLASPEWRTYSYIDTKFLIELLEEKMPWSLTLIAELLHYQNIPWAERLLSSTISDDIANVRMSFDVNKKIQYVVTNYLKRDNDQWAFLTPEYNWSWYEVAYLNSNWLDSIGSEDVPAFIKNIQLVSLNWWDMNLDDISNYEDSMSANDEKCGVDENGSVELAKWPESFMCRLGTLKDSVNVSLDFSNAQGFAYLNKDWLDDFFGEVLDKSGDDWEKYEKQWNDLFSATEEEIEENKFYTGLIPSVKKNVEYLRFANNLMWAEEDEDLSPTLLNISNYVKTEVLVESSRIWSFSANVGVYSSKDLGDIVVKISALGKECFKLSDYDYDLCANRDDPEIYSVVKNVFKDPIDLPLFLNDNKAGDSVIKIELCSPEDPDKCISEVSRIVVVPWVIQKLEIKMPYDVMLVWSTLPVQVSAVDNYGNFVWQELYNFVASSSIWQLELEWNVDSSIIFNNFGRSKFTYHAAETPWIAKININPENVPFYDINNVIQISDEISLVEWVANFEVDGKLIDGKPVWFNLPSDAWALIYTDKNNIKQLNSGQLMKLTISLETNDWKALHSWVSVSSKNWLLKPGVIVSLPIVISKDKTVQQVKFKKWNNFFIRDGKLDLYFYPKFVSGEDEITVSISWLEPVMIPVDVNPGKVRKIDLTVDSNDAVSDQIINWNVVLFDAWNNIVDQNIDLYLNVFWPLEINWKKQIVKNLDSGEYSFKIVTDTEKWWQWFVTAVVDTGVVPLTIQKPWIQKIMVQDNLLPEEDINVMYLNLFGSDWGNQRWYFSWKDKYVNDAMVKSTKMLAVTTQLINPSKIKQLVLWIGKNWQFQNLQNKSIIFWEWWKRWNWGYSITDVWSIYFNQEFTLFDLDNLDLLKERWLLFGKNSSSVFYVPEALDGIIYENNKVKNTIVVNWEVILNFDEKFVWSGVVVKIGSEKRFGKNIWTVSRGEKILWKMVFWTHDKTFFNSIEDKVAKFVIIPKILMNSAFLDWSTNGGQWLWFYKEDSVLPNISAYKSIESSWDPDLNVWFRADFKNITLFGDGKSVGESTLPFGSHFLINMWDPLLKKIDKNKLLNSVPFDRWLGDLVYSMPGKIIFKVLPLDFNNDGLQDLIVSYNDGTIKILKNYGWSDPYKLLQNLMVISDGIKDIQVGDVTGNGYDDILVWTTENKLRAYVNNSWIFDVDGVLVCLNTYAWPGKKTDTPWDLSQVSQVFFNYMDEKYKSSDVDEFEDKTLDIVVNDNRWDIKIFYGGSENWRANYLSTLPYTCDTGWFDAQEENTLLVQNFGIRVSSDDKIRDLSLVHRLWLKKSWTWAVLDVTNKLLGWFDEDVVGEMFSPDNFDEDSLAEFQTYMAANGPAAWMGNFDAADLLESSSNAYLHFMPSPVDSLPLYESLKREDTYYIPLSNLYQESGAKVDIYKEFEDLNWDILLEWDKVKVTVTIEAKDDVKMTFIDQWLWPWYVSRDEDKSLEGFEIENSEVSNSNKFFVWDLGNEQFLYMLDNLSLKKGMALRYSYFLYYRQTPIMQINIEDTKWDSESMEKSFSKDDFLDIVLRPTDACANAMWVFFNEWDKELNYSSYHKTFIDVGKTLAEEQEELAENTQWALSDFSNTIADVTSKKMELTDVPGMGDILESISSSFDLWSLSEWLWSFMKGGKIDLNKISVMWDIAWLENKLDDALDWLCGGFNKQKCPGLPLPFNMDFLSPWNFNVFGCTIKPKFKGLPIFHFPGTIITSVGTIPFPWGMKSPTDSFYWIPWWSYPSMIRIYATPTLTMQMWVSICLGPMAASSEIPPLFGDVAWNCIVVALSLCGDDDDSDDKEEPINKKLFDSASAWSCNKPPTFKTLKLVWIKTSPFELVSKSPNNSYPTPAVPDWAYFGGIIEFDAVPASFDNNKWSLDGIKLEVGPKIKNKILWWNGNWLAQCIVKDWMDRQIKYVLNNMMSMTIGITFPDLWQVIGEFDRLDFDQAFKMWENIADLRSEDEKNEFIQDTNKKIKSAEEGSSAFKNVLTFAKNKYLQEQNFKNVSSKSNNPIEALLRMFDEINMINITTQNLELKVPVMTKDEIIRYIAYLKVWLETNQQIIDMRTDMFQKHIWICSADNVLDIRDPKKIVENIKDMWKRFEKITPLMVNKAWLEADLVSNLFSKKEKDKIRKNIQKIDKELWMLKRCAEMFPKNEIIKFLWFQENFKKVIDAVRENIKVLNQYKKYPIELYEWVHIMDRYLSEATSFVSTLVFTLTEWSYKNATRFSQYVDAIVLMIGVIKTYQLLIDFSVDWSQQCGTCSSDNYDSYSCKLSFVCPNLPVIPIPPVKIPSIFIDFSHVDLGMDIKLPKINFIPVGIDLPKIPNLPNPPTLSFKLPELRLPDIPVIPAPPELPPLPSFIPWLKVDLPVLPPAPKIPKLSPSIEASIKAADVVGKIFCILKWKIWLVAESQVKSKVEQLTQRTWSVPFFDYFDQETIKQTIVAKAVSKLEDKLAEEKNQERIEKLERLIKVAKMWDSPLQWFDYKIDSYVSLRFNFDQVFSFVDALVAESNKVVSKGLEFVQEGLDSAENDMKEVADNAQNKIDNLWLKKEEINEVKEDEKKNEEEVLNILNKFQVQDWDAYDNLQNWSELTTRDRFRNFSDEQMKQINEFPKDVIDKLEFMDRSAIDEFQKKTFQTSYLDTETSDYETEVKKLRKELLALSEYDDRPDADYRSSNILSFLSDRDKVDLNIEWLHWMERVVKKVILEKRIELQETADKIKNNYTGFLWEIWKNLYQFVEEEKVDMRFDIPLLSLDSLTRSTLETQEHPVKSYLEMNRHEVNGFRNALIKNSAVNLNMTPSEYSWAKSYLKNADEKIELWLNVIEDRPLLAQWDSGGGWSSSSSLAGLSVDLSHFVEWLFVPSESWDMFNVVNSKVNYDQIWKNYTYVDVNKDGKEDVLMRDKYSVYIKYADNNLKYSDELVSDDVFYFYRLDSFLELLDDVKDDNWFINMKNTSGRETSLRLKIRDDFWEVKNFKMKWQSFDSLKLSWSTSKIAGDDVAGYLLRINKRVDSFYDDEYAYLDDGKNIYTEKQYILVLPEEDEVSYTGYYVDLEDGVKWIVDDLMTGIIARTKFYNPGDNKIGITLFDMPRDRLYVQVVALEMSEVAWKKEYFPLSTWSNQVVFGNQLSSDLIPPVPEVTFERVVLDKVLSTGTDHEWFVSTTYALHAFWEDNVAVKKMWIRQWDVILASWMNMAKTGYILLSWLFYTWEITDDYIFWAEDFNENIEEEEIRVVIKIPNIKIKDLENVGDDLNIIAEIDQDLDEWYVTFDRNRRNVWETLKWSNDDTANGYTLEPGQTIITGGVYDVWIDVGFIDKLWETVWHLDPRNGEIAILSKYQSDIKINLDFETHLPRISIQDFRFWSTLFWISLPVEELVFTDVLDKNRYQKKVLDKSIYGEFWWWVGILDTVNNQMILFISPSGGVFVPDPFTNSLWGSYEFDYDNNLVKYFVQDDSHDSDIVSFVVKVKSFVP